MKVRKFFMYVVSIITILSVVPLRAQTIINIIPDPQVLKDFMCPQVSCFYSIDNINIYASTKWTVIGGCFNYPNSNITEINLFTDKVVVYWNNVSSSNGSTPIGKLNIETTYKKGNLTGKGVYPQNILSLNGVTMLPIVSNVSTDIPFLTKKTIRITTAENKGLFFPGVKWSNTNMPVPVNRYEWVIPKGWAASGTLTSAGTYITTYAAIDITTDYFTGGEVKVRGVNDCPNSNDYSAYCTPLNFTRSNALSFTSSTPILFGDASQKTFGVSYYPDVTYEWNVPTNWKINGQGSTLEGVGLNSVDIIADYCSLNDDKVKVRIKKDGETSSWYSCQGITKPTLQILNTTYQMENTQIALNNISSSAIQSVSWTGEGVVSNGISNGNYNLIFSKVGSIDLISSVLIKDCSTPINFTQKINVLPHRYAIEGPSTVCDQATYVLKNKENLPPGATVQWSASNSNLTLVSGQGTGTAMFRKTDDISTIGTIRANITINPATPPIVLKKEIWVNDKLLVNGEDIILKSRFNNPIPGNGSYYSPYQISSNTVYTLIFPFISQDYTVEKVTISEGLPIFFLDLDFPIVSKSVNSEDYSVDIYYFGRCSKQQHTIYFRMNNVNLLSNLSLFPNPATTTVSINLEEEKNEITTKTIQTINNTQTGNYQIQLWNSFGMVKQVTTDQKNYQLDLHGIPKGFYYIHVIKDGKTHRKQLIVK